MAATAPAQTKLLTLNDLDFFLRLASEILANPDKGGLFNLDASVIYADDSSQFLTELTITLKSLRPKLLGEAKPIEFRTREEIVSAYQEEKRKEKTQHRGPPGTTRQDIERMTKKWLISQKEAALIAEHLKTTSRLTDR
ncbi:hypothetical protein HYT17_03655, partial [Candidatus Microgenomates bacterium]|nr:hypothetical protein [Candidatus Microgenomates bacterium]